jgi:hypothetical protein
LRKATDRAKDTGSKLFESCEILLWHASRSRWGKSTHPEGMFPKVVVVILKKNQRRKLYRMSSEGMHCMYEDSDACCVMMRRKRLDYGALNLGEGDLFSLLGFVDFLSSVGSWCWPGA